MGIKKIARPINKAKNTYISWLKSKGAEDIDEYKGTGIAKEWDYYRNVSAFIDESLYVVYFEMWGGNVKIKYRDEENSYIFTSIDEFLLLIE